MPFDQWGRVGIWRFLKKLVTMLLTLLIVSLLVFGAFHMLGGDPVTAMLGMEATPERVAAIRAEMGLDAPAGVLYLNWLRGFVSGDMGTSYSYDIPVATMIADKIPITLTLSLLAIVMVVILAIPLGIFTAKNENRPLERIIMVINQIFMAIPPFLAGILLTLVFGLTLRLFTPGGFVSYKENVRQFITFLFLPAFAIALPRAAMAVKLLRSSLIAELKSDYVRTAYSKGCSVNRVLYRHALRNTMLPLVTFLGMAMTDMIAGSIIIEQVFGIPGLGRILLSSIANRDYPVVMAIIICIVFMVLIVNLVIDIVYGMIDPRVKVY
ncbi:MAG: ABC transporter permease [Lachnospiraceae bacterium]|jgi:peptide/nickel transport system permease protein|nr:ABC transporter permease [Lachnospiraceae bacterium]